MTLLIEKISRRLGEMTLEEFENYKARAVANKPLSLTELYELVK